MNSPQKTSAESVQMELNLSAAGLQLQRPSSQVRFVHDLIVFHGAFLGVLIFFCLYIIYAHVIVFFSLVVLHVTYITC